MPDTILCHPDTFDEVYREIPEDRRFGFLSGIHGIEVRTSPAFPRYHRRWEFPADPFIEYEPSDEVWCRPLGIGREVDDTSRPFIALVNNDAFRDMFTKPIRLAT